MSNWRVRWILKEISSIANYRKHASILIYPWKYWMALLSKAVPGFYKKPILLDLKEGGKFWVINFMTLFIYKEIFVNHCYDCKVEYEDRLKIIDIGANTGLFAIRMNQLYNNPSIYCFEPFPNNFNQLRKNLGTSSNIQLFQKAVGGTSRDDKLYLHTKNLGGHSIIQSEVDSNEYVEVNIISLKKVFSTINIDRCHLLKLDCEGSEYEILKSIDENLSHLIEYIVFEPTEQLYDINDLIQHLKNNNFDVIEKDGLFHAINRFKYNN